MRAAIGIIWIMAATAVAQQPATAPATRPANHNHDTAVLDAVFKVLLSNPENSPVAIRGEPPQELTAMLLPIPARYPVSVAGLTAEHSPDEWRKLSADEKQLARDAAIDLLRRNGAAETMNEYQPGDPRVRVRPSRDPTSRPANEPREPRVILIYPPGYAKDNLFAVVHLNVPTGMHHADATYYLEHLDGRWIIRVRQFVYYI